MPLTFATNSTNDIYLDNDGNLAIATGIDAVLSICKAVAEAQRGEMIFNTDKGMPSLQAVWSGSINIAQYEAALRSAILNIEGVLRILNLDFTKQGNTLSYKLVILTSFGQGAINGSV